MISRISSFLILVSACIYAADAQAQLGGNGIGGGRRSGGYDRSSNSSGYKDAALPITFNSSDQLLARLQSLKTDLNLTPQQEGSWMQFEDKVSSYIEDLVRQKIKEQPSSISATDGQPSGVAYLSLLVDKQRNKYTSLEDIELNAKKLNEILSPNQKIILNSRLPNIVVNEIGK
jgi:hypothetical protein